MSLIAKFALVFSVGAAVAGWLAVDWHMAFIFVWLALWVAAVDRSVGLVKFVRFDPWRAKALHIRVLAYCLVTLASLAVTAAFGWAIVRSESPTLLLFGLYVLVTVYSIWAVQLVKSHAGDEAPSPSV